MDMKITMNANSIDDYRRFLAIKRLPVYRIRGSSAWFPDEYADRIGVQLPERQAGDYHPGVSKLFDYQRDITRLAITKRKFAVFADCGLGTAD